MGIGAALWGLIVLLAISFTSDHPWWALGLGGAGGLGLGIYFWWQTGRQLASRLAAPRTGDLFSRMYRYEILLLSPSLFFLVFASRLPTVLLFFALAWLFLVGCGRKVATGSFLSTAPLDLPILLVFLSTLPSLYAAVDLLQSGKAVCTLIAGMTLSYGLVTGVDTARKVHLAFFLFLVAGSGIALTTFLVMQLPHAKIPFVSAFYHYLPDLLPRKIHPNYIGGSLVFFIPLAFWVVVRRYGHIVWGSVCMGLTGSGLLMTQSRGALLATGAALVLTGAYWYRWLRLGLPVLILTGGLLFYTKGVESLFDPVAGSGLENNLENRRELWQRAVYITQDFPFTGIGIHSFPVVVDLLYPLFLSGADAGVPHAHNLYLEIVVSIGFPGFVAFWTLLGAWGGTVRETLVRSRGSQKKEYCEILGVGLAGGMIAHLLYSITDAIALGEKGGVVFWAVLGLTVVLWRRARAEDNGDRL